MTSVVYSVVESLAHNEETHPENNQRVTAIVGALQAYGLTEQLTKLPYAPALVKQITRAHMPDYLDALKAVMEKAPGHLDHAPTYITKESYNLALDACGAALAIVEYVAEHAGSVGFSIARPPGHHAPPDQAMGFCLVNNVAVAACHAQKLGYKRVAIFDFDVHHGNGTQDIFYANDSVLFISMHQDGIYPGSGTIQETGAGRGQGTTLNIPVPAHTDDAGLQQAYEQLVKPAITRFEPDFILISAGYDGHFRDPLASLNYTAAGFQWLGAALTQLAAEVCEGRLAFVLEGGYDLVGLGNGVAATIAGVLGQSLQTDEAPPTMHTPSIAKVLARIGQIQGL